MSKGSKTGKTIGRKSTTFKIDQDLSQRKNPFEVDNVVELILSYLSINELITDRLISKCCNRNAVRLLQKPENQLKMTPIRFSNDLEDFLNIVKNSQNPQLFRNLDFHNGTGNESKDFDKIFDIVTYLKPIQTLFNFKSHPLEIYHYFNFLAQILVKISQNVKRIEVEGEIIRGDFIQNFIKNFMNGLENFIGIQDTYFPELNEFIMNISFSPKDQKPIENLIQLFTKNSPKLTKVKIPFLTSAAIFSPNVQLRKMDVRSIKSGSLKSFHELLQMNQSQIEIFKFSLVLDKKEFSIEDHLRNFANFTNFLQSQSGTLKELNLRISFKTLFLLESAPELKLIFPILEKLQSLKISIKDNDSYTNFRINYQSDVNAWPIQPINFGEKFPNLKNIFLYDCNGNGVWSNCLLDSPTYPCEPLKEISIESWTQVNMNKIYKNFPKIEHLKILKNYTVTDAGLKNFSCLSKTLKKIEIVMSHFQLSDFDFKYFLYMPNLSEIILKTDESKQQKVYLSPIRPNFTPLLGLKKLSTLSLTGFQIDKKIVRELGDNYLYFKYEE